VKKAAVLITDYKERYVIHCGNDDDVTFVAISCVVEYDLARKAWKGQ